MAPPIAAVGNEEKGPGKEENSAPELSPVWRKAAIVGGLWASVEIIVGSFFHNMRLPLAGTVLSCAGVALLVAAHRRWPEKGLVWRAGLICALMKSISPSAVILGPMIGIFTEALLLEGGIRLFLGSWPGYLVGGAAAVSWPLVQKAGNLLITFGFDIARLYLRLYEFAAAHLRLEGLGPLNLLLVLVAAQAVLGAVAALAGLEVGRRAAGGAASLMPGDGPVELPPFHFRKTEARRYSPLLLVCNVACVGAGLLVTHRAPAWAAALFTALYSAAAFSRYSGSLRRLRRPGFWLQIAALMALSGLLLGSLEGPSRWSAAGLEAGFRMSLRAILIILGFSIIGVELRNPALLGWFARRRLRNLLRAVETAFEALPVLSAALARQKGLWKSPLDAAASLVLQLDSWLALTERIEQAGPRHFIITGDLRQGKTTLTTAVAGELAGLGFRCAGLLAPGIWSEGRREGFDALDLSTGARVPLCRRDAPEAEFTVGPFGFFRNGTAFGRKALALDSVKDADLAVVDEVGPLELRGEGWALALDILRHNSAIPLLLVVRAGLVGEVIERWEMRECRIFRTGENDAPAIAAELARVLRARRPLRPTSSF